MSDQNLDFIVSLEDRFTRVMEGAEQATKKMEGRLENVNKLGKELIAGLGIGIGLIKSFDYIKEGMNEYRKLKVVQEEMNQLLKNAGKYSEENTEQLKKQREEMLLTLDVAQETSAKMQRSAMNMFPKASIEKIKELTQLMVDVTAGGKSGEGALKALISGNTTKLLGETGKEESAKIKKALKEGQITREKALELNEELLLNRYKGLAAAAIEADPSKKLHAIQSKFQESIGHLADSVSLHFLPSIIKLTAKLDDIVNNHFEALKRTLITIVTGLKDLSIYLVVKGLIGGMNKLKESMTSLSKTTTMNANIVYLNGAVAGTGGIGGTGIPTESKMAMFMTRLSSSISIAAMTKMGGDMIGSQINNESRKESIGTMTNYTAVGAGIGNMLLPGIGAAIGAGIGALSGLVSDSWIDINKAWDDGSKNLIDKTTSTFQTLIDHLTNIIFNNDAKYSANLLSSYINNPLFKSIKNLGGQEGTINYAKDLLQAKEGTVNYQFSEAIKSSNKVFDLYEKPTEKQEKTIAQDWTERFKGLYEGEEASIKFATEEMKKLGINLKKKDDKKEGNKFNAEDNKGALDVKGTKSTNIYVTFNNDNMIKIDIESVGDTVEGIKKKSGEILTAFQNILTDAVSNSNGMIAARI